MKTMKKYEGMNFKEWCKLDVTDTRKINYKLIGVWEGLEHEALFTSDDEVDGIMMFRVCNSYIEKIMLHNNEWYLTLIY